MYKNKFDKRNASGEGEFAADLYDKVLNYYNIGFNKSNIKEDYAGIDRFRHDGTEDDIKGRKYAGPHLTWLELAGAKKEIGTDWVYHKIYISQMMVYENQKYIQNVIFGRYYAPDAVEYIINKIDLETETKRSNELYKVYHRISPNPYTQVMEHCGATICIQYSDLETLPSFEIIQVPRDFWKKVRIQYGYIGIK